MANFLRLGICVCIGAIGFAASGTAAVPKPAIAIAKSLERMTIAPLNGATAVGCTPSNTTVELRTETTGFQSGNVASDIVVTGGRVIIGNKKFLWDLTGVLPGTYMAIIDAKSDKGEIARTTVQMPVTACK